MTDLQDLIKAFIIMRTENKLINLSDDMLFDKAVSVFISQNIQNSKEKNIEKMKEQPEKKASDKQIFLLKKLGFNPNKNMTCHEAFLKIQELKSKEKEEEY